MSESHQREAALFDAAMELPPEQRAAYLDQACGGDAALRQRLESLLKAGESQCEFLDPPPDPELRPTPQITVPFSEKPGDRIGHYKLLEQIGEGGCGVVYVAEQTEPVRRRVALKIVKLGMDSKSVIARFEAERQAVALMDHPNIAKVFDAGATETGRPYFVMELVRGMKITDYCDEKKLSTHARLDLFIQVCQAIQHAHQKGIIHRDIKPSNILVTVNDGVAVPKIIDFGIAKATSGQLLTDKTIYTAFEQFIGTPAYMSPEQAVLTSLDIDTRSDIYALGVLLFELLTGKTPFDSKELLSIGLDEMRRTIREAEPPRPSTRVSTLPGQELSTTAHRRGLEAPRLVSELRGDLDWIVMKCLEKDRARRYETANGLAMDIHRHLNNEPVLARPPSALYQARKFVRRHRVGVGLGVAVTVALVAGVSLALLGLQRALRAESAIRKERDRAVQAETAQRAVLALFTKKIPADTEAILLLETAVRVARQRLGPTNETALSLIRAVAHRYGSLGEWTKALELFQILIAEEPNDQIHWYWAHAAALAAARMDLCWELSAGMLGRFGDSPDSGVCERVAKSVLFSAQGQPDLEVAFALARRSVERDPHRLWNQAVMGIAQYRLARYPEAEAVLEQLRTSRDVQVVCLAAYFYAMAQQQQGKTAAAQTALAEANQRFVPTLGTGDPDETWWHEDCRILAARAEAERLILGREVSPPVTATFLAEQRRRLEALRKVLEEGFSLAQQGHWQEARDAYVGVLADPAFDWRTVERLNLGTWLLIQMGVAFVKASDGANHERLCRLRLSVMPKPPSPQGAAMFAKVCFLNERRLPADLQKRGLELARFAAAKRDRGEVPRWTCLSAGMAEYQAGQAERALPLLQEAEGSMDITCKGGAMVYRAMTLKRLGREGEARLVLAQAEALLAEPIRTRSSAEWWDLDICQLALDEARPLIGQPPKSSAQ